MEQRRGRHRVRQLAGIGAAAVLAVGFLLVAVPASAGGFCIEPATEAKGATVAMKGSCFTPTVLRAPAGETITFVNRDAESHTVTGVGEWGLAFRHDEILPDETFSVTLDTEGIYVYSCLIHPGMAGAIVVGSAKGAGAAEASGLIDVEPPAVPDLDAATEDAEQIADELTSTTTASALPLTGFVLGAGVGGAGLGFLFGRLRRTK